MCGAGGQEGWVHSGVQDPLGGHAHPTGLLDRVRRSRRSIREKGALSTTLLHSRLSIPSRPDHIDWATITGSMPTTTQGSAEDCVLSVVQSHPRRHVGPRHHHHGFRPELTLSRQREWRPRSPAATRQMPSPVSSGRNVLRVIGEMQFHSCLGVKVSKCQV